MEQSTNIKKIYCKYLSAAFGSALIASIYSTVDAAMVGQYQGPIGTAALAVIGPIWNIIFSLGLLTGIGGSVLFSTLRGKGENNESNSYFTASLILTIIISLAIWVVVIFFDTPLLELFGANEEILPLAKRYMLPIKFIIPFFPFTQMISSFLRNDNNPLLATIAVLFGGIFNIFGDYYFVFAKDMGIFGAGLATAIGTTLSTIIMLFHFINKRNTLRLKKPTRFLLKSKEICTSGFSTFFVDVAMGLLTMLFNRQVLKYLGTDALSVYGIIIYTSTFVQCCAYSVGQASQPIISLNYGAGYKKNVNETLKYAIISAFGFGILWTISVELAPNVFVKIFMSPTENILKIAPRILRTYGASFILLPFNVFSTYYFQAILKPRIAFTVSVLRGAILSGALILISPIVFNADSIWLAMPITEFIIAVLVGVMIRRYQKI